MPTGDKSDTIRYDGGGNRNIYPDAVKCDRMRLIGPKGDQLGLIRNRPLEESK